MAKFSQAPVCNTAAAAKAREPVSFYHNGELRLDRRPYGKIKRFIDPVGNVITVQLAQAGHPTPKIQANKVEFDLHAEGWVEHTECPLSHGRLRAVKGLAREFAKMPASLAGECESDPVPFKIVDGEKHANEACKHIEWLISHRRAVEAKAAKARNAAAFAEEKRKADQAALAEAQLEMVKEQIEERKARKRGEKKAPTE